MSVIDFFEYLASSEATAELAHELADVWVDRQLSDVVSARRLGGQVYVAADGIHAGAVRLVRGRSSSACRSVRPMSSRPLSSRCCVKSSSSNVDVEADRRRGDALVLDVDDDLEVRVLLDRVPEPVHRGLGNGRGDEAHLPGVVAEDVGEARRQHGREAVVHAAPTPRARVTSRCRSSGRRRGSFAPS